MGTYHGMTLKNVTEGNQNQAKKPMTPVTPTSISTPSQVQVCVDFYDSHLQNHNLFVFYRLQEKVHKLWLQIVVKEYQEHQS